MRIALLFVMLACSSSRQATPRKDAAHADPTPTANVPADAMVADTAPADASVVAVDAGIDAAPARKTSPAPKKAKHCPACGIGCPNGVPSSKVDANGCPVCACEDLRPLFEP